MNTRFEAPPQNLVSAPPSDELARQRLQRKIWRLTKELGSAEVIRRLRVAEVPEDMKVARALMILDAMAAD